MKIINGFPSWATDELTLPPGFELVKANCVLAADEGKPLHRAFRKGRLRKLIERMKNGGWGNERPLLAYYDGRNNQFLTGAHRWAAAYETNTGIPTLLLDLSQHGFSEDCRICGPFTKWDTYECPCEVLTGYRDYREIESALRNLGYPLAADLFAVDARKPDCG